MIMEFWRRLKKLFKTEYFWIGLILAGAFIVRLYGLNNPVADWHSWRQADTASVSKTYLNEGINLLYPRYHDISSIQTGIFNPHGYRFVEFPLFNVLHVFFARILPVEFDSAGRLVSIVASLVSTYLLYLIGKRFIGRLGAILSAFFFAFLPYNIYFSRVILPEPLATTLALGGIWIFIRFIDSKKDWRLFLSGALFALALLVKPFTIFYLVPVLYLMMTKFKLKDLLTEPKLLIKFLLFLNIVLVPLLAWRAWITNYPVGVPFFSWAFNGDHIRFRPAFWRWIFGERLGRLILGVWGVFLFGLGILKTRAKSFFVAAFLIGMFVYVSVVATANVRHDYYQILAVGAIALALGQGGASLLQTRAYSRWLARIVFAATVVFMLGMGAYQVKAYYQINHPEIIRAGAAVDRTTPPDALVIAPYNGDTAFLYQTGRWGWPAIDNSIDKIIERGADYYVSVTKGDADTQMIRLRFKPVEETDEYVIFDLGSPIK
jgi:4-amino-4-deoxy-L-arabinose transferase-like glycosyltransferase